MRKEIKKYKQFSLLEEEEVISQLLQIIALKNN